jgi:ERAP1-like C-terminal domain
LQANDSSVSGRWQVPLQVRSGSGASKAILLTQDGQTVPAGRCDEPLSINARGIGFFRAEYDPATLSLNTRRFSELDWGDRIAQLDDQWALVESNAQPLPSYLALVEAMGSQINERAWSQIAEALGRIEYDERGNRGHDAFAAYARSILQPVVARLGWDPQANESPGLTLLRRVLIQDMGAWGDAATISEARARFARFVQDRSSLKPDDQQLVLPIVARYADTTTFEQLHAIGRSAHDETELRRDYLALMHVADPQLAQQAARILMSDEIPPQAASLRFSLVVALNDASPAQSWQTFSENSKAILESHQPYAQILMAQYAPQVYWNSLPIDQLESYVKSQVSADMAPVVARGMETARFQVAEKSTLVQAADQYVASRH